MRTIHTTNGIHRPALHRKKWSDSPYATTKSPIPFYRSAKAHGYSRAESKGKLKLATGIMHWECYRFYLSFLATLCGLIPPIGTQYL